jgi:hypothetical protein
MKRRILVISRNEQMGNWFRFMLAGLRTGMPTTVTSDLREGLRAMKRLRPKIVLFVDEGKGMGKDDDRLMLLQAILLLERQNMQNSLALHYDLADGRLTMYHNVRFPRVTPEEVVKVAVETASCPLFGCGQKPASEFPQGCGFSPLVADKEAAAVVAVTEVTSG